MILRTQIGGFLSSPGGPQDYSFAQVLLPKLTLAAGDVDLEQYCLEVSNQLRVNACVANACADAIELCNGVDGIEQVEVSRLQIYFDGRSVMSLDGITNESSKDEGMYIRAAFQAMNVFGICSESLWPYRTDKVNERPGIPAIWYALKHKLHSYYRISSARDLQLIDIRNAIRGQHPVVFGVPVTEALYKGILDPVPPPQPGDNIIGMHGIMGMGVIGEDIKIRNSWGPTWGKGGYIRLHQDWFLGGHVQDPWCPTNGLQLEAAE